ncbi:transketolase [Peptoniphilaceae bacterium SGI.131]
MNSQLAINTVRVLASDSIDKANSGHPGLPLGAAPAAFTLFDKVMKHSPKNLDWVNRDRFILSAGHGSALLYSLYHLFGYGIELEDLKSFRQLHSKTPGHPEYGYTKGVEATTGPLGQGLAMAVGMAMAEAHLAGLFNEEDLKPIDHYTYTLVGDGCLMEGITNEAASLAGTLGLNKLIVLYDSNNISIEGDTSTAFSEDVRKRFEALGWDTYLVEDGNDIQKIEETILKAKKSLDKPSFIEIKTKIGYGSALEGSEKTHGSPLGFEGTKILKKNLGLPESEPFTVEDEVRKYMEESIQRLNNFEDEWNELYAKYKEKYPQKAETLEKFLNNSFDLSFFDEESYTSFEKDLASRASSGKSLNRIAEYIGNLFGGSADLAPSNNSDLKGKEFFSKENPSGQNIHFGVREHAMAAIANGISLHGGLQAYVATFFVFSDYLKPALRLSALMKQKVIYILTHDSIGVGEDGPTHQPIDQASMIRSIPNVIDLRPADNRETAYAWRYAMESEGAPIALMLTRQDLPSIENTGAGLEKGAYVVKDFGANPELIVMASGSELKLAYDVCKVLSEEGKAVRLVSVPSFNLFDMQSKEYREEVLPNSIRKRVSIEVYNDDAWYKYVGLDGKVINLKRFGESGPAKLIFEEFGFTVDKVLEQIRQIL